MNFSITISLPEDVIYTFEDMANIAHKDVRDVIADILIQSHPDMKKAIESFGIISDAYKSSKAAAGSGSA